MVSWGVISTLCISVTGGFTVAGMVLHSNPILWPGMVGFVFSSLGFVVSVKNDEKRQKLDRLRNPRVWTDDAWYVPPWIRWAFWAMVITVVIAAAVLLNRLAELGY